MSGKQKFGWAVVSEDTKSLDLDLDLTKEKILVNEVFKKLHQVGKMLEFGWQWSG